jgi:hypothetical protein
MESNEAERLENIQKFIHHEKKSFFFLFFKENWELADFQLKKL